MAGVRLVRWPADAGAGRELASAGVAVLYLVNTTDDPPQLMSCIEDWIRTPGDDRDLDARLAALELRARAHQTRPRVDDDDRLYYHGHVIVLPADEAQLARVLTERFGRLVLDDDLVYDDRDGTSALPTRVIMARLRVRLRDLDLILRRIRRKGYILQRR